jgi:hypothetical protein
VIVDKQKARHEKTKISEKKMVLLWNKCIQKQRYWFDLEGNPVEIFYPGRLNDCRGGDFKDALVGFEHGVVKKGCIELHTSSSSWQSHGHHRDSFYNQVILHIVLEKNHSGRILHENGYPVPTIILSKTGIQKREKGLAPTLPCHLIGRRKKPEYISDVLRWAGVTRFEAAENKFDLKNLPDQAGQELYQGILEALGYSKNKIPFRRLAGLVTLNELEETMKNINSEAEGMLKLLAILLGTAGLLSQQGWLTYSSNNYKERLENVWAVYGISETMSTQNWELFKVRPGNYPVRRIEALCHLLLAWRERGFFENMLNLLREVPLKNAHLYLENEFIVTTGKYASNDDTAAFQQKTCLLGRPRAAEIVVNVLLPFFSAWGHKTNDPALINKICKIYDTYPRIETNSIERHMIGQLSIDPNTVNFACSQQGLVHIYKLLCTQGRCGDCRFSY